MLFGLALMGFLVALLPLAIVLRSGSPDKFGKLAWVTAWLTFDLILFGAFTRLTDSGLGCPDWPGCYDRANPFLAHAHIVAAQTLMPDGPVSVFKAWVEMIHRFVAMALGFLIIVLGAVALRRWAKTRAPRFAPGLPFVLFFWVCLQGAFGAYTVTQKLQPIFVTLHLLFGMGLFALLAWLALLQTRVTVAAEAARLRWAALVGFVLLIAQIALGGWVSSNYATLACTSFPLCQGQWLPEMSFDQGFALWRELGRTDTGGYISFAALTAIHVTHRSFAFVVFFWLAGFAWLARKVDGLRIPATFLIVVLCLQLATGIATVVLHWPLLWAVIHTGGAALLVFCLVVLNYRIANAPREHTTVFTESLVMESK